MRALPLRPARADMALSKVVVDFTSARAARDDIEITNPADEILYVSIEPAEILTPAACRSGG